MTVRFHEKYKAPVGLEEATHAVRSSAVVELAMSLCIRWMWV